MRGLPARKLAVEVLTSVEVDKAYANLALASAFKRKSLPERDRAFVMALVQGVLRHRDELDAEITKLATQPLAKMSSPVKNVLRVAFFQLKYMDDIPPSAVLNTATELGKSVGHPGVAKFITGVLRSYLRGVEKKDGAEKPAAPEAEDEDVVHTAHELSHKYSVPEWLVQRWLEQRGPAETKALLVFSQTVPPLTVRVCESGIDTEALMNLFTNYGIKVKRGELVESCLHIEDRGKYRGPIDKLPGYADGLFIVQDESAAFASQVVDPKPGELVVDLCAAPGGKAIHMAEMMEGKGKVVAVDTHENRLNMLKQTRQRVGLTNIETVVADGTNYAPTTPPDRILIDAPCTGTGVINRRSDLRFKREAPDVESLVELQRRLLDNAAGMLKNGGTLVYSTCSIEPEENEQNLQWFLENHPDFSLSPLTPYAGAVFQNGEHREEFERGWIQLLPSKHAMSGFFVARLTKA
jgi:16S rRNA (cytosine967-C5)-methyltransferase